MPRNQISSRRTTRPPVFSREASRLLDRLAVEQYRIPSIVLMENAANHLASHALSLARKPLPRVLIFCGPGNNGGDGLAMARHLHNAGARVRIVLSAPDRYQGDAAINLGIAEAMGLRLLKRTPRSLDSDLIVDALLGTGLTKPVREPIAGMIQVINEAHTPVLSVDIPSGLDADGGHPLGLAVRADLTVTMAGLKAGFLQPRARDYTGRVVVADIGVPRELVSRLATPSRTRG